MEKNRMKKGSKLYCRNCEKPQEVVYIGTHRVCSECREDI
jgi:hypothetical protein